MSRPRGDPSLTSELDLLQRKYRSMELHRRDSTEDNSNTLRMQRAQIEKLKKDHERVKEELALETRQAKLSNNMSAAHSIAKLQDQGDIYQRKTELEKRRIHALSQSVRQTQEAILVQRKASGGINAARDSNLSTVKQIRILENRLDKALVKFNEALAHNKALRETIDNLRRERVVFDGIYRKLERELGEKKGKMSDIIEVSHASYEARDAAQSEMFVLQANAEEQQRLFEKEWNELGELIHKDALMKQIISTKEQERSQNLLKAVSSPSPAPAGAASLYPPPSSSIAEEELRLRKKVQKTHAHIDKDKLNITLSQSKVTSYEQSFALIQKATGIEDIEQLVTVFLKAEDENFSLFNFVNALNSNIETVEDDIARLRRQMQIMQGGEAGDDGEQVRKALLTDLRAELDSVDTQRAKFEREAKAAEDTIAGLSARVVEVFRLLYGDGEEAKELLGGVDEVSQSNVVEVLGFCEAEVNRLIDQHEAQRADGEADQRDSAAGAAAAAEEAEDEPAEAAAALQAPTATEDASAEADEGAEGEEAGKGDAEEEKEAEETAAQAADASAEGAEEPAVLAAE